MYKAVDLFNPQNLLGKTDKGVEGYECQLSLGKTFSLAVSELLGLYLFPV